MNPLICILSEVVEAEYAQWMRYNYLSALGHGLYTDILSEHFKRHAYDELEHAEMINRWIVDLGGVPPTAFPPVEQFCGTTEEAVCWLVDAEIEGLAKYTIARELACDLPGLQAEIDGILLVEHEHLSDLGKLIDPVMKEVEEAEPTIVIVARLVSKINPRTAQRKPHPDPRGNLYAFLNELLQLGAYALGQAEYTPETGRQYAIDHINSAIGYIDELNREVETGRVDPTEFKEWLEDAPIYLSILEWLQDPATKKNWEPIHEAIWPEFKSWYVSDVPEEKELEPEPETPEEVSKRVRELTKKKPEPSGRPEIKPPSYPPTGREESEMLNVLEEAARQFESPTEKVQSIEEAADTIMVGFPGKKNLQIAVPVGTSIRNKTKVQDIPTGTPGRTSMGTGKILSIDPNVKSFEVETRKGDRETWYQEDELELDREELKGRDWSESTHRIEA
jgi:bacterioferritin (cytochrome b1)